MEPTEKTSLYMPNSVRYLVWKEMQLLVIYFMVSYKYTAGRCVYRKCWPTTGKRCSTFYWLYILWSFITIQYSCTVCVQKVLACYGNISDFNDTKYLSFFTCFFMVGTNYIQQHCVCIECSGLLRQQHQIIHTSCIPFYLLFILWSLITIQQDCVCIEGAGLIREKGQII